MRSRSNWFILMNRLLPINSDPGEPGHWEMVGHGRQPARFRGDMMLGSSVAPRQRVMPFPSIPSIPSFPSFPSSPRRTNACFPPPDVVPKRRRMPAGKGYER